MGLNLENNVPAQSPQPKSGVRGSIYPPTLLNELSQPVPIRSQDAVEAHEPGVPTPWASAALKPLGWNNGTPDTSRMVGWTLTRTGSSKIVQSHAFAINPQAITRSPTSRNQMFATQGGFYVDNFGPGSETIQLTQLVAHGRQTAALGGAGARATAREDVVRFYDLIYTEASANPDLYDVYFYDNHFWDQVNARTPEKVYFPPNALQITRSVQQHNVWQLQLQMGTLVPVPAASKSFGINALNPKVKIHVVKRGETLKKIAAKLAGRNATNQRILQLEQSIEALTKKYGQGDITKSRSVTTYNNSGQVTGTVNVTRMHLAVGEKIVIPAG